MDSPSVLRISLVSSEEAYETTALYNSMDHTHKLPAQTTTAKNANGYHTALN
jgi:hypothetical protein